MNKFLSRKFLLTLVATIFSVGAALGIDNGTLQIAAYAGAIIVNIIYIIVEGKLDKANLVNALKTVSNVVEDLVEPAAEDTTASAVESTEQTDTIAANQATTSTLDVNALATAIAQAIKAATTSGTTI